jgi:hypothetical protein
MVSLFISSDLHIGPSGTVPGHAKSYERHCFASMKAQQNSADNLNGRCRRMRADARGRVLTA